MTDKYPFTTELVARLFDFLRELNATSGRNFEELLLRPPAGLTDGISIRYEREMFGVTATAPEPIEEADPPSIDCPRCGMRSYHPKDISERYCGFCHRFHEEGTP